MSGTKPDSEESSQASVTATTPAKSSAGDSAARIHAINTKAKDHVASTVAASRTETDEGSIIQTIRSFYFGNSLKGRVFRFGLITFDVVSIAYFVGTSMVPLAPWMMPLDIGIAVVIIADLAARFMITQPRSRFFTDIITWLDLIVVATLLLPALFSNLLFLRMMRAVRLLRSYHVLRDVRQHSAWFARHEPVIHKASDLVIFIFIMTAIVFVVQNRVNPQIESYVDALYFTVTTLTTTGYGDITLVGTSGRVLSVLIMVLGVALFLRLIQEVFRPDKYSITCPDCGLNKHDADAVHCKHCGHVINIPTSGLSG
ncbi:MAG: ion channel [Pseudomonadota bacterium]